MKRAAAIVLWAALLLTAGCSKVIPPDVSEVSIVPVPMRVEKRDGFFVLDGKTTIQTKAGSPEAAAVGRYLAETVKKAAGFEISVV